MRKSWTENFVKLAENCLQRILAMEFPPYVCRTTRLNSWKCQFDEIFSSSKPAKQISIRILILVNLITLLFSRNIFELRIDTELISRNMMNFFSFSTWMEELKKHLWWNFQHRWKNDLESTTTVFSSFFQGWVSMYLGSFFYTF